jgi:hypothetical protein
MSACCVCPCHDISDDLRCDIAFCARSDSELPYDDDDHVIDFFNATCFQAISISATVVSLPPSGIAETLDFLRRLASMMSGGRNAEMLLQAATHIETLGRRALSAEQLFHAQQQQSAVSAELRQAAELAADRLTVEVDGLKTELLTHAKLAEAEHMRHAEETRQLTEETQHLTALVEDAETRLALETQRLSALVNDAQVRLARADAEIGGLRNALKARSASTVAVPVHTLRLARAQFNHLAQGFERSGDLISQTICEIGGCALDQALAGDENAETADANGS